MLWRSLFWKSTPNTYTYIGSRVERSSDNWLHVKYMSQTGELIEAWWGIICGMWSLCRCWFLCLCPVGELRLTSWGIIRQFPLSIPEHEPGDVSLGPANQRIIPNTTMDAVNRWAQTKEPTPTKGPHPADNPFSWDIMFTMFELFDLCWPLNDFHQKQ